MTNISCSNKEFLNDNSKKTIIEENVTTQYFLKTQKES